MVVGSVAFVQGSSPSFDSENDDDENHHREWNHQPWINYYEAQ